jgi:hypothetical protein
MIFYGTGKLQKYSLSILYPVRQRIRQRPEHRKLAFRGPPPRRLEAVRQVNVAPA